MTAHKILLSLFLTMGFTTAGFTDYQVTVVNRTDCVFPSTKGKVSNEKILVKGQVMLGVKEKTILTFKNNPSPLVSWSVFDGGKYYREKSISAPKDKGELPKYLLIVRGDIKHQTMGFWKYTEVNAQKLPCSNIHG